MYYIYSETAGIAWLKASEKVLTEGLLIKDGDQNLKELLNVFITVENPLEKDRIIQKYADKKMIRWMENNFLSRKGLLNKDKYSYAQRMFSYNGIDQIEGIINKLKKNHQSKSASINLLDPSKDLSHVPCIISIDFKIRKGKLVTTAIFRSQDVYKKLYADIFAIGKLSEMVASRVNVKIGMLNILAVSLHTYENDWDKMKRILLKVHL